MSETNKQGSKFIRDIGNTCNLWGRETFAPLFAKAGYDHDALVALLERIDDIQRKLKSQKIRISNEGWLVGRERYVMLRKIKDKESFMTLERGQVKARLGMIKHNKKKMNVLTHQQQMNHQVGLSDAFLLAAEQLLDPDLFNTLNDEAKQILYSLTGKANLIDDIEEENDSIGNV